MFSYLKILDICEDNLTLTFHGKIDEIERIKNGVLKKFMGNISIIYKQNNEEFFVILCKNQTCSKKLKNLDEINNYINNNLK